MVCLRFSAQILPEIAVRFIVSYGRNLSSSQTRAVGEGTCPSRNGLRSAVAVGARSVYSAPKVYADCEA